MSLGMCSVGILFLFLFFFFKQKTAYEMRISDWSSDVCSSDLLAGWNGIGFVIQAYQKRAPFVIDYVVDLAKRSRHRLMIRLVKGAYWDTEIKAAQEEGLEGYTVYTRKVYTDEIGRASCRERVCQIV